MNFTSNFHQTLGFLAVLIFVSRCGCVDGLTEDGHKTSKFALRNVRLSTAPFTDVVVDDVSIRGPFVRWFVCPALLLNINNNNNNNNNNNDDDDDDDDNNNNQNNNRNNNNSSNNNVGRVVSVLLFG